MSDRPRRKRKQNNRTVASNVHYIGYVEDEESIEAIMKKFEEVDRIREEFSSMVVANPESSSTAETTATDDATTTTTTTNNDIENDDQPNGQDAMNSIQEQGLTDEQLQEIFKRTSSFTVQSATMDALTLDDLDAMEVWQVEYMNGNTDENYEEDEYIHVDDEFWDMEFGEDVRKRSKRQRGIGGEGRVRVKGERLTDRERILARYKVMQVQVQDQNGKFRIIKRRVNSIDPSLPTYVRLPGNPMPRSWCHSILSMTAPKPVVPPVKSRPVQVQNILETDLTKYGDDFSAIYMDPPLLLPGEEPVPGKITIEDLSKLNVSQVVKSGFLFVWVEKEWIRELVRITKDWGFKYVENFCWIKKSINNQIVRQDFDHFKKSKLSLLIFRKEGDIELRHQRNPDCVFDFIKPQIPGEVSESKPEFMYTIIETLLPYGVYHPVKNPKGDKLMELWAKRGQERAGWTTLVENYDLGDTKRNTKKVEMEI